MRLYHRLSVQKGKTAFATFG